jgi:predicted lipoprotein with Yx(FWY)xxD motif
MTRTSPIKFLSGAAAVPLVALAVAGCGSSSSAATTPTIPKTAHGKTATVGVSNSALGKILVDSQGRTLYLFKKDSGTKSACSGACATHWPPLRATGKPTLGSGLTASKVSTTKRSDGRAQVTYNGHPLYLFAGDQKPGDTTGQGVNAFGAGWFVLSPAGTQISASAPSSSGGSSSGGGY